MNLPRKRHKYGAVQTICDGHTFPSKAEAKRYGELKLLQQAGKIGALVLQPPYPLLVNGIKIGEYIADFLYTDLDTGKIVVEDCKGFETPMFKWKRKHFEAQMNMKITVIHRGKKTT